CLIIYCLFSIHRNYRNKKGRSVSTQSQKLSNFVAQPDKFRQRPRGPRTNLAVPGGGRLEEGGKIAEALLGVFVRLLVLLSFRDAIAQNSQSRIDFALLAFV